MCFDLLFALPTILKLVLFSIYSYYLLKTLRGLKYFYSLTWLDSFRDLSVHRDEWEGKNVSATDQSELNIREWKIVTKS